MSLPAIIFLLVCSFTPQSTRALPVSSVPQMQAPKPNPDANGVSHFEKGVVSIPELIYSVEPEFLERPASVGCRAPRGFELSSILMDTCARLG